MLKFHTIFHTMLIFCLLLSFHSEQAMKEKGSQGSTMPQSVVISTVQEKIDTIIANNFDKKSLDTLTKDEELFILLFLFERRNQKCAQVPDLEDKVFRNLFRHAPIDVKHNVLGIQP